MTVNPCDTDLVPWVVITAANGRQWLREVRQGQTVEQVVGWLREFLRVDDVITVEYRPPSYRRILAWLADF